MEIVVWKTVLAFVLLGLGVAAARLMLSLQGRAEAPDNPGRIRRLHRTYGYLFATVLVVLAVLGATILGGAKDGLPLRGVVHWVLGSLLLLLVVVKIVLMRFYKKFMRMAPALGLTILVAAFLVAMVSAGYLLVTGGLVRVASAPGERAPGVEDMGWVGGTVADSGAGAGGPGEVNGEGSPDEAALALGERVYEANCSGCHLRDSRANLVGPGLEGLFQRVALESTGERVNRRSVTDQIVDPVGTMPSFESQLSDDEVSALVTYLETL